MEIDSLVISLGLDPARLREGLGEVQAALVEGRASLADFVQGIQEGFQEALQEVAQGGSQAAGAVDAAGEAAEEAGERFRDAGKRGAEGMQELEDASGEMARRFEQAVGRFSDGVDRLGNKAQQAANKAKQAGSEVQAMGRKIGGFLRGIVSTVAAPLAGALSAGAIMGSYFSDVAQMAEQTGRYSKQLEEARKKKALLARVNKEDVELYRKGKLALLDFDFAMAGLSATIMRALSPAIRFGIGLLNSLADWVRRNEPNIIRFITVLAGTITAALIPSFYKLARAMLMNPLTWIIAGILLLAIVIDDLVTYIRGGNSQFAALWSQFGTGEEIAHALGEAWEWLKSVGQALFDGLLSAAKAFIGNFSGAFAGLKGMVEGTINFIKALFAGNWEEAGQALRKVFESAIDYILGLFMGIFNTIRDALGKLLDMIPSVDSIKKGFSKAWDATKGVFKGFFGGGEDESKEQESGPAPATPGAPQKAEAPAATGGAPAAPVQPGAIPSNAQLTQAGVPVSATINNTRNVNTDIRNNVTLNMPPGSDANAIAGAVGSQVEKSSGQVALAADGGVRL